MKRIFAALTVCLALTVSCEKSKEHLNELGGKWIIKKMLVDPGDGSGRYQNVTGSPYISFNPDGSAGSNYQGFGIHMLKSYKVTDTENIVLNFRDISSQPTTAYRYKFMGDTLVLSPPCLEACGIKLVRAN